MFYKKYLVILCVLSASKYVLRGMLGTYEPAVDSFYYIKCCMFYIVQNIDSEKKIHVPTLL